MNKRELRQFRWAFPMMILGLSIAGCSARQSQPSPSSIPAASPIPTLVEITPTAEVLSDEPTITPTIITTPMLESVADTGVRYTDKFEDPATGWPQEEFDNYFIGYHEPDYYHINVRSSNDKELVPVPNKESYGDITVEAEVLTDLNNTAESGDYRYGVAFRRSGDQYYVFAISPRSGKWYVLKSSPDHLEVLKEGSDDSIQGLDALDTLQVDVRGTNFYFHINDQLIDQVSDSDYAEGEVGLFVQTLDTPRVHAHFDSITIRDVDAPQQACKVDSFGIRMRRGPSTSFDPIGFLTHGDTVEPQGRNPDANWIQVRVEDSDRRGWIFYDPDWISCNVATSDLPVVEP